MQIVSEKTGLKINFIEAGNYKDFAKIMINGEADIICGFDKATGDGSFYKIGLSKPYLELPLSFISLKGHVPEGAFTVGIADGGVGIRHNLEKNYPQALISEYDSLE